MVFAVSRKKPKIKLPGKLLVEHSKVFKIANNKKSEKRLDVLQKHLNFKLEGSDGENTICLEGVDGKAFSSVADYCRNGTVPEWSKSTIGPVTHVYDLAARFGIHGLMNRLLDNLQVYHYQQKQDGHDVFFSLEEVRRIYSLRKTSVKLWSYCVTGIAFRLVWRDFEKTWTESFKKFCKKRPKIMMKVKKIQLRYGKKIYLRTIDFRKSTTDATGLRPCKFHLHPEGDRCHLLGKEIINESTLAPAEPIWSSNLERSRGSGKENSSSRKRKRDNAESRPSGDADHTERSISEQSGGNYVRFSSSNKRRIQSPQSEGPLAGAVTDRDVQQQPLRKETRILPGMQWPFPGRIPPPQSLFRHARSVIPHLPSAPASTISSSRPVAIRQSRPAYIKQEGEDGRIVILIKDED